MKDYQNWHTIYKTWQEWNYLGYKLLPKQIPRGYTTKRKPIFHRSQVVSKKVKVPEDSFVKTICIYRGDFCYE